jgi:hypothetical protein
MPAHKMVLFKMIAASHEDIFPASKYIDCGCSFPCLAR